MCPPIVDVDGVEVDTIPQGNLLMVRNDDTPGTVGRVGTFLGGQGVNIARMGLGEEATASPLSGDLPPAVASAAHPRLTEGSTYNRISPQGEAAT